MTCAATLGKLQTARANEEVGMGNGNQIVPDLCKSAATTH